MAEGEGEAFLTGKRVAQNLFWSLILWQGGRLWWPRQVKLSQEKLFYNIFNLNVTQRVLAVFIGHYEVYTWKVAVT